MQAYIDYLLQDMAAAHRNEEPIPPGELSGEDSFETHIAEVEKYLQGGEPNHTFGYYCGLESVQFPPTDRLNSDQLSQFISAFNSLLLSWNLGTDIPDEAPTELTYRLLVSVLDQKTEIVDYGMITLEFCTYDQPSCLFGEHCMCKDIEDWHYPSTDAKDGDLPF